jgi:hypothetical protein
VSDGTVTTPATLTLPVNAVDDAPVLTGAPAVLDGAAEDTAYTVTQAQLVQGFTDVEGDVLSASGVWSDYGWVADNGDGSWTITPYPDYNGPLTLYYAVTGGTATTQASLGLTLGAVNDTPVLNGWQTTLPDATEDTVYTVTREQLVQGFWDVDGDALSATDLTVDHGTAVQEADGSWTITLEADYNGPLTLSYGVSDGTVSTPATLSLAVAAVNDGAPELTGTPAVLEEGTEDAYYTVTQEQLLQGYTDADGDALSVTDLTADHGSVWWNGDGSWTIVPEADYHGPLTLSYGVSDGTLTTTPVTLGLTLAAVNDAPALTGWQAALEQGTEDTAYTVTQAQLLEGYTDVEGDGLSAIDLTVDHGTAVQNWDGSWTITPEAHYNGSLTLSYVVTDGTGATPATLGLPGSGDIVGPAL